MVAGREPPLGIDRLSVFAMPPVEFIGLAASLACTSVALSLAPTGNYNPHGYRGWSLRDDPALRRDCMAAARATGVAFALFEGFAHVPGQPIERFARDLDLVHELGGQRINLVSLDKDMGATAAAFARFTALAVERGLVVSGEMGSLGPIASVAAAKELLAAVAHPAFTLLIDAMHFFRLGNSLADFAALDPAQIGYVQLCDAPLAPRFSTYIEEAMYERMVPGEGELPLAGFIALLPEDVTVSLEIPRRALAEVGVGPRERLAPCVVAARRLLDTARKEKQR